MASDNREPGEIFFAFLWIIAIAVAAVLVYGGAVAWLAS